MTRLTLCMRTLGIRHARSEGFNLVESTRAWIRQQGCQRTSEGGAGEAAWPSGQRLGRREGMGKEARGQGQRQNGRERHP